MSIIPTLVGALNLEFHGLVKYLEKLITLGFLTEYYIIKENGHLEIQEIRLHLKIICRTWTARHRDMPSKSMLSKRKKVRGKSPMKDTKKIIKQMVAENFKEEGVARVRALCEVK